MNLTQHLKLDGGWECIKKTNNEQMKTFTRCKRNNQSVFGKLIIIQ